jgi:hypothetical protein
MVQRLGTGLSPCQRVYFANSNMFFSSRSLPNDGHPEIVSLCLVSLDRQGPVGLGIQRRYDLVSLIRKECS